MRTFLGTLTLTIALTTAGAVARQALNLGQGGPVVGWTCLECRGANADDPTRRFTAACRHCGARFAWEGVVGDDRF